MEVVVSALTVSTPGKKQYYLHLHIHKENCNFICFSILHKHRSESKKKNFLIFKVLKTFLKGCCLQGKGAGDLGLVPGSCDLEKVAYASESCLSFRIYKFGLMLS